MDLPMDQDNEARHELIFLARVCIGECESGQSDYAVPKQYKLELHTRQQAVCTS
jgi:hypothetical protein